MRLAQTLGLDSQAQADLYFALLLKDSGCSSNAARMYEIYGSDDISNKRLCRITDWSSLSDVVKYASAVTLPEKSLLQRARRLLGIAANQQEIGESISQTRCSRGAQIALSLGLSNGAAECIASLEERWDGTGNPNRLRADEIPLLSRIAAIAQTLEVFAKTFDRDMAYTILRKRSGKWFDPEMVKAAQSFQKDDAFWEAVATDSRATLLALDCAAVVEQATDTRLDAVCNAFAQIVDAKSPFTGAHSSRVCAYAVEIGEAMGIRGPRLTTLRRAALLHDIGKLGVSNTILDKPGQLDDDEWKSIRLHPYYTHEILGQITGFARLTEIASAHHERLDGTGYHLGLSADRLDLEMRILAVADVFDALRAKRPYREALPIEQVFQILDKDAGKALDGECIASLKPRYLRSGLPAPSRFTGLRLAA